MCFSKEYTSVYNRYCLKMFFSKLFVIHKENKQKKYSKLSEKQLLRLTLSNNQ